MDMRETRWIRDNGIRDEGSRFRRINFVFFHLISIGTGSPTTLENFSYALLPLSHATSFQ
jgi:hypothetical protein